jgi:hypothetical protein
MHRAFFTFLLALNIGTFANAGIVPQHAVATPRITYRQVVATTLTKKDYDQSYHQAQSKLMDHLPAKIYAQLESLAMKRFQSSLSTPWPSIHLPDFSFLWKQEHGDQRKNPYDRGQ